MRLSMTQRDKLIRAVVCLASCTPSCIYFLFVVHLPTSNPSSGRKMAKITDGATDGVCTPITNATRSFHCVRRAGRNHQTRKATSRPRFIPCNLPLARAENTKAGFRNPNQKKKRQRFASEVEKCYVGPMPVDEFIRMFLPIGSTSDDAMPVATDAFKAVLSLDENGMKTELCTLLVSDPASSYRSDVDGDASV